MEVQLLDSGLLKGLHEKAATSERLRQNFDLRTSPEDGSQRMLNVLEVGTRVPIHRHLKTSETVVYLEGCLDWVFYEEMAGVDTGGPVHDGETAADETQFVETARFRVCPREKVYGIQVPKGAWHSIEVHEPSTIFEAKDGAYGK
jgi:cupin fold WbuC family metalloprotein